MQVRHAIMTDSGPKQRIIQLLHAECPNCRRGVEFILAPEDEQFEQKCTYLEQRLESQNLSIIELKQTIAVLLSRYP